MPVSFIIVRVCCKMLGGKILNLCFKCFGQIALLLISPPPPMARPYILTLVYINLQISDYKLECLITHDYQNNSEYNFAV